MFKRSIHFVIIALFLLTSATSAYAGKNKLKLSSLEKVIFTSNNLTKKWKMVCLIEDETLLPGVLKTKHKKNIHIYRAKAQYIRKQKRKFKRKGLSKSKVKKKIKKLEARFVDGYTTCEKIYAQVPPSATNPPGPTSTEPPGPSPTSKPTAKPTATKTPVPSSTKEPSSTATPTASPEETPTTVPPTPEPTSTVTPEPTYTPSGPTPIIIDHTATEFFDKIPQIYLDKITSEHWLVHIVGMGHIRQLVKGLELLGSRSGNYPVQISTNLAELTATNKLRVLRSQFIGGQWSGERAEDHQYWSTSAGKTITINTATEAKNQSDPFVLSMWSWSWDICKPEQYYGPSDNFTEADLNNYLTAINDFSLNASINQSHFVYTTANSDCTYSQDPNGPYRTTFMNEAIRQAAASVGGIFFDDHMLENWNIDNTEQRIEYDRMGRKILPRHSDYDEDNGTPYPPGYTNQALCIRKAKAFWVLLAVLAGWDGQRR